MIRNVKLTLAASFVASLVLMAAPAFAGQRLSVEKNHTMRVTLREPAGSVIVGNPEIADVNVVDSRTVYIMGKGFGSSSVVITSRDGRPLFDGEVAVTSARKGAITVYKGLKPSLMVCSTICIAEDATPGNTTGPVAAQ